MKPFQYLLTAVCILISSAVFANVDKPLEGIVHGYVVDAATRKPISGVMISATSSKSQASVSTDSSGYFRFNQVAAPDEITFEFEKKGYKIVRKEKFNVRENTTFKFTVEMSASKEEIQKAESKPEVYEHPLLRMADGR